MVRTLDEIREQGMKALINSLGKADALRFIQQFERGSGDYTRDRRAWVEQTTLDDIMKQAQPQDKS